VIVMRTPKVFCAVFVLLSLGILSCSASNDIMTLRHIGAIVVTDNTRPVAVILEGPSFVDADLAFVAKLPTIQRLVISNTKVNGSGLKSITSLLELKVLNCMHSQIEDVGTQQISNLTGLQTLVLQGTRVSDEGLRNLRKLNKLRDLDLTQCVIGDKGLAYLADGLTNLTTLNISYTNTTSKGIAALALLPELQSFTARGCKGIRSDTDCLTTFKKLRALDLAGSDINDFGVNRLRLCRDLQKLVLSDTAIGDSALIGFSELMHLEEIHLDETKITNRSLMELARIPTLQLVELGTNANISAQDVGQLKKSSPNLKVIYIPE